MTGQPAPRHVLVVATQCTDQLRLDHLPGAAQGLYEALTDRRLGGCVTSPAEGAELVRSGSATRQQIDAAVRAAITHAGEAGAVLVLAFLGHGQASADATTLHYMASDTLEDNANTSVDVAALLSDAADERGIGGVVAVLDTCHAAAGLPSGAALASGYAQGRKRLAVLMAAAAHLRAYDLELSRALAGLLREGIADGAEFLTVGAVKTALGGLLLKQDTTTGGLDGDPDAETELWLSRNARHRPGGGRAGCLGALGTADLAEALEAWPEGAGAVATELHGAPAPGPELHGAPAPAVDAYEALAPAPPAFATAPAPAPAPGISGAPGPGFPAAGAPGVPLWTRDALTRLASLAAASADPGAMWVRETAETLVRVVDTGEFLIRWAAGLTTQALRDAVATLNRASAARGLAQQPITVPPELTAGELLRHVLEYAALRTAPAVPAGGGTGADAALARCVVAVAHACGLDPKDERVRGWASASGCVIAFNDAVEEQARPHAPREPRLVISLHAARYDWPESLSVWLREGDRCDHRREFGCEPTRDGVEGRFAEILDWAQSLLPGQDPLRHIDIAAHSPVLLDWRPERALAGRYELGVRHTVTLRWAHRLSEPSRLRGMNREARDQLRRLREHPSGAPAPVDWLNASATGDPSALEQRLRAGAHQRAIGVDHRPPRFVEIANALLPYTPILLWPEAEDGRGEDGRSAEVTAFQQQRLAEAWPGLPAGFGDAYRRRRLTEAGAPPPAPPPGQHCFDELAGLRTAWHDLEWLDFCGWLEGRLEAVPPAPTLGQGQGTTPAPVLPPPTPAALPPSPAPSHPPPSGSLPVPGSVPSAPLNPSPAPATATAKTLPPTPPAPASPRNL